MRVRLVDRPSCGRRQRQKLSKRCAETQRLAQAQRSVCMLRAIADAAVTQTQNADLALTRAMESLKCVRVLFTRPQLAS